MNSDNTARVVPFGEYKGMSLEEALEKELTRIDDQPTALRQKMRDDARAYIQSLEKRRAEMIARFNISNDIAEDYHNKKTNKIIEQIESIRAQIEQLQDQSEEMTASLKREQERHVERKESVLVAHNKSIADINDMIAVQEHAIAGLAKPLN